MHFHNFGSANVVGIHSCTNLQKENIFYPIAGIIDIPNMQHTVLFNIGFSIGDDCWERPDCTCKALTKKGGKYAKLETRNNYLSWYKSSVFVRGIYRLLWIFYQKMSWCISIWLLPLGAWSGRGDVSQMGIYSPVMHPIIKHPKRTFFYFLWFELTSE